MDQNSLYDAVGAAEDHFLLDTEQVIQTGRAGRRPGRRAKGMIIAIAAAIAVFGSTAAIAARMDFSIIAWIQDGFAHTSGTGNIPAEAVLQEELEEGQWVCLEGENIAVIIPESPVKILLSSDAGKTWRESTVVESENWEYLDRMQTGVQYWGGYIGFYGKQGGYLVLTSGVAMNHQCLRIYLTNDGGTTWSEIGNPYSDHISVLTGAGFASDQVGFISYRYYEDTGPDIWWTRDGGQSWARLELEIPEEYQSAGNLFTPQSPVFDGEDGIYPIIMLSSATQAETTIFMYTHDGGLTWRFEK